MTTDLAKLVAELRALEAKATLGPWKAGSRPFKCEGAGPLPCDEAGGCSVCGRGDDPDQYRLCPDDVAFITAMRNALPALLQAVESRVRAEKESAQWSRVAAKADHEVNVLRAALEKLTRICRSSERVMTFIPQTFDGPLAWIRDGIAAAEKAIKESGGGTSA